MMTNFFSAEHEQFRQKVRSFIDQHLRPRSTAWEEAGDFPRSVLVECAQQGLFQSDPWCNGIVAEELPRCESLGFALSLLVQSNLVIPLLEAYGTEAQRATYIPGVSSGQMMGAMAVTEPLSGSDFAALQCRAHIAGDNLILNGEKTYITNAALADFLIVAARIPEWTEEGLTLILVPSHHKGVTIDRLPTLGLAASGTGRIRFDDCAVERGQVLGSPGDGFAQVQRALNRERLFGGLACVAWADYAMQKTLEFARARTVFGSTINRFQVIRHEFAEMATRLEAARSLNYVTFSRWIAGESVTREICMMKLFSYQAAQQVITECLQIHGGLGYMDHHWTSRFYRDARALTIAAGTPEVIREMIAAFLRV